MSTGTFILQTNGSQDRLMYGSNEVTGGGSNPSDQNITTISADEVLPGLWIGNQASSQSKEWLKKHNIKTVINASKHIPFVKSYKVVQIRVPVNDPGPFNGLDQPDVSKMFKALPCAVDMIHESLGRGGVLVHCHAGMQRSAAIVSAYLAKHYFHRIVNVPKNKLYDRSTNFLHSKRSRVFYNNWYVNFQAAIKRYINHMEDVDTAKCAI